MVQDIKPGTLCRYNSADTQALGSLLISATGRTITDYMREKLCEPLGFEAPGYWLVDSSGREMAFGGLKPDRQRLCQARRAIIVVVGSGMAHRLCQRNGWKNLSAVMSPICSLIKLKWVD